MNRQRRYPFGLLLLGLSLIAASSAPAEPPPLFVTEWGSWGDTEGQFRWVFDVAVDSFANVYVADKDDYRIQKFDSNGNFLMMWGWGVDDGTAEFQVCSGGCERGILGNGDGQFDVPQGVVVDTWGNVYVADTGNHRIQKFDRSGNFVKQWGASGTGDEEFDQPIGLAVDSAGNLYVTDRQLYRVQKFNSSGTLLLMWGWGVDDGSNEFQVCTDGCEAGIGDYGDGQFTRAESVAIDASGKVYVADATAFRIQEFSSNGAFLRMWGWGVEDGTEAFQVCTSGCQQGLRGSGDGQFDYPDGVSVDASGNVYVTNTESHRIQKFDRSANLLTTWGSYGSGTGQFMWPESAVVDAENNIYVGDTLGHRVQKFAPALDFFVGEPVRSFRSKDRRMPR